MFYQRSNRDTQVHNWTKKQKNKTEAQDVKSGDLLQVMAVWSRVNSMGVYKHINAASHTVFAHIWRPTHKPQHSIFFYIIPNFGLAICKEKSKRGEKRSSN